jgi:hypothetical protein
MREILLHFTFKLHSSMVLTRLQVHTTVLKREQLDAFRLATDKNTIEGHMTVNAEVDTVIFYVQGTGDVLSHGSFNFKVGTKKVFEEDQTLHTNEIGRIEYLTSDIILP